MYLQVFGFGGGENLRHVLVGCGQKETPLDDGGGLLNFFGR